MTQRMTSYASRFPASVSLSMGAKASILAEVVQEPVLCLRVKKQGNARTKLSVKFMNIRVRCLLNEPSS